jgi:hypothetical protein
MRFSLFTKVALKSDLPAHHLQKGDVVTIVETHSGALSQETGYTVEVFNATGDTVAVVTVPESFLEPLTNDEILHVRQLQQVAEPRKHPYQSTKT